MQSAKKNNLIIPTSEIETKYYSANDPVGIVFEWKNEIYRAISHPYRQEIIEILSNPIICKLIDEKWIQKSEITDFCLEGYGLVIRHEHLDYLTYPFEWSDQMLLEMAKFVISLSQKLLEYNLWIYDLFARNFAFKGTQPIFLDICAISTYRREKRLDLEYVSSFYSEFINRLILASRGNGYIGRALCCYGETLQSKKTATRLTDKIKIKALTSLKAVLSKNKISSTLQSSNTHEDSNSTYTEQLDQSKTYRRRVKIILFILKLRLKFILLQNRKSSILYYYQFRSKDKEYLQNKEFSVSSFLKSLPPSRVLDIACNTGMFAKIALKHKHSVMAFDGSSECIDKLYLEQKNNPSNQLNLSVFDFYKISHSHRRSLTNLKSALRRWRSDVIMFFAFTHHIVGTKRFDYQVLFSVLYELTNSYLMFEYVPARIEYETRNHSDFSLAWKSLFILEKKVDLGLERSLYIFRKKASSDNP